jgi:hypothetical protein
MGVQIKTAPENELWLHTPSAKGKLDKAVAWAERHLPKDSDLDLLERKIKSRSRSQSSV